MKERKISPLFLRKTFEDYVKEKHSAAIGMVERPYTAPIMRRIRSAPFSLIWSLSKDQSLPHRIAALRAEARWRLQLRFYESESPVLDLLLLPSIRLLEWPGDFHIPRKVDSSIGMARRFSYSPEGVGRSSVGSTTRVSRERVSDRMVSLNQ